MPEYDIVVLVPVKMRIAAKDDRYARTYGPSIVGETVKKTFTTEGLFTLKNCQEVKSSSDILSGD